MTATPEELTLMLYNGAIKFVNIAKLSIENKNIKKAHEALIRAQDIIIELNATLNMDYEISKNLRSLYEFILDRLVDANIKKEIEPLDEVLELLTELRDTWKEVIVKVKKTRYANRQDVSILTNEVDELIKISKEKSNLLNSMLQLTKEQKKAIEDDNIEKINYILDLKDDLIKEIDKLDGEFMLHFSELKKKNSVTDLNELNLEKYPNIKELKSIVSEVTSTLVAISMIDKENNDMMTKNTEDVKAQLRRVKEGKKAYKGYKNFDGGSMFIDEKKQINCKPLNLNKF